MPLKIIGTGLGRTGTHTLKTALNHLGFGDCYHMVELFQKPEGLHYFEKAERGEAVDWNRLFHNYNSAVDYPVARYFRQISDYYPEAKIIHTYRDPQVWFESAGKTIFIAGRLSMKRFLKFAAHYTVSSEVRKRLPVLLYNRRLMKLEFGNDISDKKKVIKKFEQHTENVIKKISSERLLLYNVSEGWEPLCKFLGVPVPAEKYPHTNTREEFYQKVEVIGTGRFLNPDKLS
jgi:hypothetical protein